MKKRRKKASAGKTTSQAGEREAEGRKKGMAEEDEREKKTKKKRALPATKGCFCRSCLDISTSSAPERTPTADTHNTHNTHTHVRPQSLSDDVARRSLRAGVRRPSLPSRCGSGGRSWWARRSCCGRSSAASSSRKTHTHVKKSVSCIVNRARMLLLSTIWQVFKGDLQLEYPTKSIQPQKRTFAFSARQAAQRKLAQQLP